MSTLNLLLQDGRIYCRECLCQIPVTFLACPSCAGLVRERGRWVMPAPAQEPPLEDEAQPLLFDLRTQEYPA